jgi:STE24 endopeptidase
MRKVPFGIFFIFLSAILFAHTLYAAQPSPQISVASAQQQSQTGNAPSSTKAASPRTETPKKITAYTLPPDLYRKAHTRGRILFSLRLFSFFYGLFVLWLLLQGKLSAKYRDWAENFSRARFLQALLFTPLLVLTIGVLQLPLDVLQEWIEKLYGISVQPWGSWMGDWAKAEFLVALIGIPLAWILYAVIRRSPRRWWLHFWFISLPILLFIIFVSPYVIDPLFNKYEPLAVKAPQLVAPLQQVTRRAGMEISPARMFWMNASDKTIATNASVNGFGASKRIIIWDTTIAQESTDEVVADFGHEMGHYVLGHIWKGLLFAAALLFVLLFLGYRSIDWLLARSGVRWGIRQLDDLASLPALLLLVSIFGFLESPVANGFSRYQENQADVYGLEVTHGLIPEPGQACAETFQNFGEKVLVDPNPNPVDVFLYFDHPSVSSRIHLCLSYDPWSKGQQPQFVK